MSYEKIDELKHLSAFQILEIWKESGLRTKDPLERSLLCNAMVLAACCFSGGEPVFQDEFAVLKNLSGRKMERLLRRISEEDRPKRQTVNPQFDMGRFKRLEAEE